MITDEIYQKILSKLHTEILKYITLGQLQNAAIKLEILNNNKITFYDKNEEKNFYDFNIYEEVNEKKRIIDIFYQEYKPQSIDEVIIINAMKNNYTSIFLIKEKGQDYLVVEDLINHEKITIKNPSFLEFCKIKQLLFTRIIEVEDTFYDSGLFILFSMKYKRQILKFWKMSSLLEADDTHHFINLFHLHRRINLKNTKK